MAMADQAESERKLLRALIYGKDKTKKTTWACAAAAAGFNVILLDGDDGSMVVKQLPAEAKRHIQIVDLVDRLDRAVFMRFMLQFFTPNVDMTWFEAEKRVTKVIPEGAAYTRFRPNLLTPNDIVIIDSWTALADSTKLEWAIEKNVDMAEVDEAIDKFDLFGYQARYLDYVLTKLHGLPCHVIVIGHEQNWDQYKGAGKDRKIVGTFRQAISSTGPHGQKLGSKFSEILYFSKITETAYRIGTGGDNSRMGGSRTGAPKTYNWDEYSLIDLLRAYGWEGDPTQECVGGICGRGPIAATALGSATSKAAAGPGNPLIVDAASPGAAPKLSFGKK